jgi:hypothetical protein
MSVGSSSKPRLLLLPLSPKLKTTRKKIQMWVASKNNKDDKSHTKPRR